MIFPATVYSNSMKLSASGESAASELFKLNEDGYIFDKNNNRKKNNKLFDDIADLSVLENDSVNKYLEKYLADQGYLIRCFNNSNMYLPVIEKVLEDYPDFPKKLSYLPLLESSFNPNAVSKANAVGLWQFMEQTSSILGLKNNRWVDERRDVEKSTIAAVRHLTYLYSVYGNWEFALSAYNAGEKHVNTVISENNDLTYWEMAEKNLFKEETNQYVARFCALCVLFDNSSIYNINYNRDFSNEVFSYKIEYPIDLNELSRKFKIPRSDLHAYNPELKTGITPIDDSYYIKLPVKLNDDEIEKFDDLYRVKYSRVVIHKIRKGETIGKISKNYSVKIQSIIFINNINNIGKLKTGDSLYIPIN